MKKHWFLFIAVLSWSALVVAQVGGNSSTSAGGSVTSGQANANVNSSQNAQAGGASANSNVSGSAQTSQSESRHEHETKAGTGSQNSGTAGAGSAALSSSNALHAELTKPIDAGKAKPGDDVSAKLTQDYKSDGKVVFHKGSKVVGHVTEVQAHSKDHAESRLGIAFDKIQPKGGQEASVQTTVQALAPPVHSAVSSAADESLSAPPIAGGGGGGGRSGGGLLGGVAGGATSTVGGVAGGAGNVAGGVTGGATSNLGHTVNGAVGTGLSAQGTLTNASRGAIGLQGLSLSSVTDASAQGSVISSATRTVKLESGTQMLLQLSGTAK